MKAPSWLIFALLGAFFAAVVNVLSKKALDSLDFLAALTIQALLALLTLGLMVTVGHRWQSVRAAPRWALWLMAASGVAAGLAWACGYRALQLSDVNHASPIDKLSLPIAVIFALIFLREKPSLLNWIGIILILVGAICVSQSSSTKT